MLECPGVKHIGDVELGLQGMSYSVCAPFQSHVVACRVVEGVKLARVVRNIQLAAIHCGTVFKSAWMHGNIASIHYELVVRRPHWGPVARRQNFIVFGPEKLHCLVFLHVKEEVG